MVQGRLTIRFYGVRGSLPVPGPATVRTGGNTSCVLVQAGDQNIVLDCGTGMRVLGVDLMSRREPVRASVLLTHYHWDHMLGLPFFYPIYRETTELAFYGERKDGQGVADEVVKQFTGPNFPVEHKDLVSTLHFTDVAPGDSFSVGDAVVRVGRLNHPNLCLCFRVEYAGSAVVYATDHEHGSSTDSDLVEFASGADCLIYDQMYTPDEYPQRRGFGHSTWREAVRVAQEAGVRTLFLFHHEPGRDDDAVDAIEAEATRLFAGSVAAREGYEYTL